MQDKPIYKMLFEEIKKDFDIFEPSQYNIFFTKAVAGSGKTYNILQFLRYFYGEYITKNKFQVYRLEDGNEKIIPAGEGNMAEEDYQKFLLKTNNREDVIFSNRFFRSIVIAYNSDIKKEIDRRMKNDTVLKEVKDLSTLTKTSHSLLFSYAQKAGIMPTKNELGEYTDGKIKTNFAKGDFNLNDSLTALDILQEKSPFFKKVFSSQNNKTKYKLAKILLEVINIYYNSDIIIDNPQKIEQLIKIGQKNFEEDIKEYINSFFNEEDTKFLKEKTNQPPYFSFFINGIKSFKIGIKEGRIELGHSYYYKEVFNLCMKEKERLVELFAIEHNPEKYLNIVIVDEAQDLTPIMTRLLIEYYKYAKQNHLEVATVIVGDEKQSIYQFANRINSFNVIERELDKNNIKNLILNKTYRVPKKIASFTNEVCKKLNIYDKETELVSARKAEGEIIPNASLLDVVKNTVEENKKLIVLGRTNAEILIKYIKTMSKILKDKELSKYAKYIKVDSKYKKQFKKLLKDGIDAIDDTELIDKLKVALGKNKITFRDIKNNQEDIKNFTPQYLIEFANLIEEMKKEEIEEILSIRPSTKPNAVFMTMHSSKGLESDEVYILNGNIDVFKKEDKKEKTLAKLSKIVQEKLNKNPEIKITDKLKPEENELLMEKYLLYVAFTRAKEILYLEDKLSEFFKNEIEKTIKQELKETPKVKASL